MKIIRIGDPQIVMDNPYSKHNYFGWPTVARLQNGKVAVVASGFRLQHVCPFGKAVISYSEDEGKTYTRPAVFIDTVLDDRDAGITPFGKSSVLVTSFNNAVAFQRERTTDPYKLSYLDTVTPEEEKDAMGATFRISHDFGVTFGEIFKSPVTSPHGPVVLRDGSLLWVGRTFSPKDAQRVEGDSVQAYRINPDGSMEFVGKIENVDSDGHLLLSCEPHVAVLDDGRLLAHIRAQYENDIFTLFQTESSDNGKTWTKPKQILSKCGGAPAHLLKHSSGILISTYGFRGEPLFTKPYGVKAMFSRDNGKTWDTGYDIYKTDVSYDLGYPSSIELSDGSLLTVFYATPTADGPAVILQQRWRFEDEI